MPFGRPVPVLDLASQYPDERRAPPLTAAPRPLTFGQEVPGSRREEIRYLMAAYDRDIANCPRENHDRARRRDVMHGRRVLGRRVGAWPWAVYVPDGKLPPGRWWEDEPAVAAWRRWAALS